MDVITTGFFFFLLSGIFLALSLGERSGSVGYFSGSLRPTNFEKKVRSGGGRSQLTVKGDKMNVPYDEYPGLLERKGNNERTIQSGLPFMYVCALASLCVCNPVALVLRLRPVCRVLFTVGLNCLLVFFSSVLLSWRLLMAMGMGLLFGGEILAFKAAV